MHCHVQPQNTVSTSQPCAEPHELSIVLCDDEYMAAVNKEWRGQNRPTDVLSFEIPHDEFSAVRRFARALILHWTARVALHISLEFIVDHSLAKGPSVLKHTQDLPVVTLGDIIISLETADRQAVERQHLYGAEYVMYDEVRVLLVHGLLHLLGFDHELGPEAAKVMADEETKLMRMQGWQGQGLIEAVNSRAPLANSGCSSPASAIRLVCLDMDGTLLDSQSRFSDRTVAVLKKCIELPHVTLMLATGKARPAAISACRGAGLAGMCYPCPAGLHSKRAASCEPTGGRAQALVAWWTLAVPAFFCRAWQPMALTEACWMGLRCLGMW
jgi:rRNA maturation RNase YbeY